jgi:pilus assembly protein CpaC
MRASARLLPLVVGIAVYGLTQPVAAAGQAAGSQEGRTVNLAKGTAQLVTHPASMRRVSVASADVAEAVVVSPNELLIHGREIGTTSLVIWDAEGGRTLYPVEVTLDAAALQTHFRALFPDEQIEVSASGNVYILSGSISNATVAERAVEIAEASEAMVVNNMSIPRPHQILPSCCSTRTTRGVTTKVLSRRVSSTRSARTSSTRGAVLRSHSPTRSTCSCSTTTSG